MQTGAVQIHSKLNYAATSIPFRSATRASTALRISLRVRSTNASLSAEGHFYSVENVHANIQDKNLGFSLSAYSIACSPSSTEAMTAKSASRRLQPFCPSLEYRQPTICGVSAM